MKNANQSAHFLGRKMLFLLGSVVMTRGAQSALPREKMIELLVRHVSGDWGVVCQEDKATNDAAIKNGSRILSAYPINPDEPCAGFGENTIWIITEADRSVTTFLLPDEY